MTPRADALSGDLVRADARASAAGAAGHCRRGADQYGAGAVAIGGAVAAGQPRRYLPPRSLRLRWWARPLRRARAAIICFILQAKRGTGLGRDRSCWAGLARLRHARSWRFSLNCWRLRWWCLFPGDRERTVCGCRPGAAIAAIFGAMVFPLVAHWMWGGGWLSQLGANFGLGAGFLDGGGAATVHVLGGVWALARGVDRRSAQGQVSPEGLSTAMPGHNAVYVLFGCLLALVGWLAWNMAGALLWLHAAPAALRGHRGQHAAFGRGGAGGYLLRDADSLRQARRQPVRQRLAGRTGDVQRLRGAGYAAGSALHGTGSGHYYAAAGGTAGTGALDRRSVGRHQRSRRGGVVGAGGRGDLRAAGLASLWRS